MPRTLRPQEVWAVSSQRVLRSNTTPLREVLREPLGVLREVPVRQEPRIILVVVQAVAVVVENQME